MIVVDCSAYGPGSGIKPKRLTKDETRDTAHCTICAAEPSPGFYTGCMIADGHGDGQWACDGKGNLTRPIVSAGQGAEK